MEQEMGGDETNGGLSPFCPGSWQQCQSVVGSQWQALKVSAGATRQGIRPRQKRLSGQGGEGPAARLLPPPQVSSMYRAPALCQAPCPTLGTQKPQGSVHPGAWGLGKRQWRETITVREVTQRCTGGLAVKNGFLEEVILIWVLPSKVWS